MRSTKVRPSSVIGFDGESNTTARPASVRPFIVGDDE
jgi:hypothetical protein